MPNKIVWEPQGIYWKYTGKVSGKEIIDASTSVYGDPRFDNIKYKLTDFLDVESMEMSDNELTLLACQHKAAEKSRPNVKNAIVIRSEDAELAHKFSAFFTETTWEVKVFNDLAEADEWLGRKPAS